MTDKLPPDVDPNEVINMKFERVFCSRHGEPLRANWPNGYAVMLIELFDYVFRQNETLVEARKLFGDKHPDPKLIELVLDQEPACCRVPDRALLKMYEKADFGVVAKCDNCRHKRLGAPYTTTAQRAKHLCFECVVFNMTPMQ